MKIKYVKKVKLRSSTFLFSETSQEVDKEAQGFFLLFKQKSFSLLSPTKNYKIFDKNAQVHIMHRYISCMDTHCAQIYIMQIHIVHGYMSWISKDLLPLSSLSLSYIFILLFCFFVNLPNMHDSLNIIFSFTCVQILFKQYHSVLIGVFQQVIVYRLQVIVCY